MEQEEIYCKHWNKKNQYNDKSRKGKKDIISKKKQKK